MQMNYSVIVPVLEPDEKTTRFIDTLIDSGFKSITVVDDGSSESSQKFFDEIRSHDECEVLVHEVNKGKGAALKTAFKHLHENKPEIDAAITADGDGQHTVECINSCIEAYEKSPGSVIFGGRDFSKENVPTHNKLGNRISSVVYGFACGIKLKDTQTGLRIIPAECFEEYSTLKGDRYEYETNMIISIANDKTPYKEVPIETIYIDDNASSHFNVVKDSVKIYVLILKNVFKFILNSLISWVVDEGLAWLFLSVILSASVFTHGERTFLAMLFARIISSLLNYALNRKTVFKSKESVWKTVLKYYVLAACMLAVSIGLVELLAVRTLKVDGFVEIVIKCIVDIILFFASYTIQRKWVFKKEENNEKEV